MRRINVLRFFCLIALLATFGCGGGGGGNPAAPPVKAVISFSLLSSQRLPFRIAGVQLVAKLPDGVTVSTDGAGALKEEGLFAGSAVAGAANPGFPLVSGSYLAPIVSIVVVSDVTGPGFGPGEIARLTCAIAPGTAITESDLLSQLTFKASGSDPNAAVYTLSPLNSYLSPSISVTYLP